SGGAAAATFAVTPATRDVAPGERVRLAAVVRAPDGAVRDVTRRAAWRSSSWRVARVTAAGVVVGGRPGTATIRAAQGGRAASAVVRVGGRATGPLRVSAANPRYFADPAGRVVYLAGGHTWADLVDSGPQSPPPRFDARRFLDTLLAHGHNVTRLWAWEQATWTAETGGPYHFAPVPFRRTGPGRALDGKPRFDLTRLDPAYFRRLRARVAAARERGIYTVVMLFDGWSVERKGPGLMNPWDGHPFNAANNVNGVDGDPDGDGDGAATHRLRVPAVTRVQEAYVRAVVDAVGAQPNVLYEISNESSPGSIAWQRRMTRVIRAREAARGLPRHPVGITAEFPGGRNGDLAASGADWISPNGSADDPAPGDGRQVVLLDTDHLCGVCGDPGFPWRSLARGVNPLLMDVWDGRARGLGAGGIDPSEPRWEGIRRALGATVRTAARLDLARMTPRGDLASTGYCLADAGPGGSYLVYAPGGGDVTVDLSATPGPLRATWIDPRTGAPRAGGEVTGGRAVTLAPPAAGDAVLILDARPAS
ncbi:MAG: putative collagen-binding domain-containing protein, partial [Actinomycetota bacterium]